LARVAAGQKLCKSSIVIVGPKGRAPRDLFFLFDFSFLRQRLAGAVSAGSIFKTISGCQRGLAGAAAADRLRCIIVSKLF